LRRSWYNDAFHWNTTGIGPKVDIETVALHENGHALGLGHFGTLFLTDNGKLHVAPYAVMNAIILGTLRRPLGTDNASFCCSRSAGMRVVPPRRPGPAPERPGHRVAYRRLVDLLNAVAGRFVLLTVPGPDRWIIVFNTTPETDPARMFATLQRVGRGSAVVEQRDAPLERFTIRSDSTRAGRAFLMEWERFRVRVPVRR
jgi:hypothetical protein